MQQKIINIFDMFYEDTLNENEYRFLRGWSLCMYVTDLSTYLLVSAFIY